MPLLEGVIETVLFAAQPLDAGYRLAAATDGVEGPEREYVAEPDTGRVLALDGPSGRVRIVNSSIIHWLWSLHLVGTWYATSTAIQTWDGHAAVEELALTELAGLLDQIRSLDPPAYGKVGDHDTHFWPAALDRWLY